MTVKTIKNNSLFYNPLGHTVYTIFVMFALAMLVSACSVYKDVSRKTKNVAREFKEQDEDMKKMIAMVPFENRTRFSDPNQEMNFSDTLVESIDSACSGVHILHPGAAGYPGFLGDLPKQGQGEFDNLELAKEGRPFGLNGILTITLTGVIGFKEIKGFWWFKDTHYFIQVQIEAEIFDTETAAKLLDEIIIHDIEVEAYVFELLESQNSLDPYQLEEAYEYFASTITDKVCDAVVLEPWKGYVLSVAGEKITLSSGETSGIELGQVLEVFDSSEIIQGKNDRRFFMPGPKTGEITITKVFDYSAEAVMGSDSVVQVGNMVKIKD